MPSRKKQKRSRQWDWEGEESKWRYNSRQSSSGSREVDFVSIPWRCPGGMWSTPQIAWVLEIRVFIPTQSQWPWAVHGGDKSPGTFCSLSSRKSRLCQPKGSPLMMRCRGCNFWKWKHHIQENLMGLEGVAQICATIVMRILSNDHDNSVSSRPHVRDIRVCDFQK